MTTFSQHIETLRATKTRAELLVAGNAICLQYGEMEISEEDAAGIELSHVFNTWAEYAPRGSEARRLLNLAESHAVELGV